MSFIPTKDFENQESVAQMLDANFGYILFRLRN